MSWIVISLLALLLIVAATIVTTACLTSCSSTRARAGLAYKNHTKEFVLPEGIDDIYRPYMLRKSVRHDMVEMFVRVSDELNKAGVQWWMVTGTLLGTLRHGGIIPWDDDMDVGVNEADLEKLRSVDWASMGYRLSEGKRLWKIQTDGPIRFPFVDVVPCKLHDGKWRYCLPVDESTGDYTYDVDKEWPNDTYPDDWIFPLKKVAWEHIEVWVPKEAERCVQHTYGDNAMKEAYNGNAWQRNLQPLVNHRMQAIFVPHK